jgi:hypothetical protein
MLSLKNLFLIIRDDLDSTVLMSLTWCLWMFNMRVFIYIILYTFCHCTSNQIQSVDDVWNKSYRVIPSRLMTLNEVRFVQVISNTLFITFCLHQNILTLNIGWVILTGIETVLFMTWIGKNLFNSLGYYIMLVSISKLAGVGTMPYYTIIKLCVMVLCSVQVQDIRDIVGDLYEGRPTFPIIYGERLTKYSIIGFFLCMSWIEFRLSFFYIYMIYRVYHSFRTTLYDHYTYRLYILLFNLLQVLNSPVWNKLN